MNGQPNEEAMSCSSRGRGGIFCGQTVAILGSAWPNDVTRLFIRFLHGHCAERSTSLKFDRQMTRALLGWADDQNSLLT